MIDLGPLIRVPQQPRDPRQLPPCPQCGGRLWWTTSGFHGYYTTAVCDCGWRQELPYE